MTTSVAAPAEDAELGPAITYPHLIVRINPIDYRCARISVRVGDWPLGQVSLETSDSNTMLIHPEAFNADGTVSAVCRRYLIGAVQAAVRAWKKQMLIVWSPTSCTYVEGESSTEDTTPTEHQCREITAADALGNPPAIVNIAVTYGGRRNK